MDRRSFNRNLAAGLAIPFVATRPAWANLDGGRNRILRSGILRYIDYEQSGQSQQIEQVFVTQADVNIRGIERGSQMISLNSRYRSYQVGDDGVDQASIRSDIGARIDGFSEGGTVRQFGSTLFLQPRVSFSNRVTLDLVADYRGYWDTDVNSRQLRSDVQLPRSLRQMPVAGSFWIMPTRRTRFAVSIFFNGSIANPNNF